MKIIAIGGGEIGRPGTRIETESIDREIIRLTGKKRPKLLFLPTASGDSESYYAVVQKYFGKRLGCQIDVLYVLKERPSAQEMRKKVFGSDIIYVGGGNTLRMLKRWRSLGLDDILIDAAQRGIVLSGVSAGAICWFRYGNSDSLKFSDDRNPLIRMRGLDLAPLMVCPHYDAEKDRRPTLRRMIMKHGGRAIALENCVAIEIVDAQYRIIASSKKAHAYLVYKKDGVFVEKQLPISQEYAPLRSLCR